MEPFVGEIRLFPYNFVPKGWLPCDGRLGGVRNFVFGHNMSKRCMYANQKEI